MIFVPSLKIIHVMVALSIIHVMVARPRFKVRAEGDWVRVNDQIVFESIKTRHLASTSILRSCPTQKPNRMLATTRSTSQ